MRITGGKAARRILKVPKGLAVRPTPDLVKQAVFNSLGDHVAGARVLDDPAAASKSYPRFFEDWRRLQAPETI